MISEDNFSADDARWRRREILEIDTDVGDSDDEIVASLWTRQPSTERAIEQYFFIWMKFQFLFALAHTTGCACACLCAMCVCCCVCVNARLDKCTMFSHKYLQFRLKMACWVSNRILYTPNPSATTPITIHKFTIISYWKWTFRMGLRQPTANSDAVTSLFCY